jgi:hypothetical protein
MNWVGRVASPINLSKNFAASHPEPVEGWLAAKSRTLRRAQGAQPRFWIGSSINPRRTALRDRRGAVYLLGIALLLLLTGCGRVQQANPATPDSYAVTLAADSAPPVVGDGAVNVTLHNASGTAVNDAQLAIEANMSHAGMTPVMANSTSGKDGVYHVPLTWTMAGDWYVDVKFTLPDGQVITRRFPVQVLAR